VGSAAAAIARALASAGAKVALGARRLEALEDVKATIEAAVGAPGVVIIVKTDVTKREDVSGRGMCCASSLLYGDGG
jgi:NADP-dependent 3-hydroxy acid dehydrogenase YdfG